MKDLARPDGPGCRPSDDAASRHPGKAASIPRAAPLKVLDLFSGIGGFSLGLERTGGFKTVAFCEIEPFPRRVLAKHWPEVPCYDDVRTLTADRLRADGIAVDVITGGFPCQDLSGAGAQAGIDGERSGLWREIARLARDLRPQFIILENVADLLDGPSEQPGQWFGALLGYLAEIGFDAQWRCIPASAVGAEHDRDRVWVVSYPNTFDGQERLGLLLDDQAALLAARRRNRASVWLETTLPPPRVADGLSAWVDRRERTEGLGNSVVPQIPELIGSAILASFSQGIEAEGQDPKGLGALHESPSAESGAPQVNPEAA